MPRFYFHFHGAGSHLRDEQGMTLPDSEAAWYQAVRSARELIQASRELGYKGLHHSVEIVDEGGAPVSHIPIEEIATYAT